MMMMSMKQAERSFNREQEVCTRKGSLKRRKPTSCVHVLLFLSAASCFSSTFPTVPVTHAFALTSRTAGRRRSFATSRTTTTLQESSMTNSNPNPNRRTWRQQRRTASQSSSNAAFQQKKTLFPQQQPTVDEMIAPMPITGYDAEAILSYYDKRPLEVGWRLNTIGFPLLGWYLGLLQDSIPLKWGTRTPAGQDALHRKRGAELRQILVRTQSVALIKSGQALSLRPDLIRNKIWAEELGKLVDAVGSFSDYQAMKIISHELTPDIVPRIRAAGKSSPSSERSAPVNKNNRLQSLIQQDPILSLFEFYNDGKAVASASIGQVYKARIKRGMALEAAIGKKAAARWGGTLVAIKVQRPNAQNSASLDMYLIRRATMWLSMFRGGDLPAIADQFGMQLFGELDYIREANNCERFGQLYRHWDDIFVPSACTALTRRRVLVMEWVDGVKGPWNEGIEMVRIGLKCSVNQLMSTGLFHADPHRGNLLKTSDDKLAFIDFGMMADVSEEDRYGLVGLVIGLQNKDLPLVTENLLKLGFLRDTTQLDQLVPRLRAALLNATGGTGKASDVNFAQLQAELDAISRENVVQFSTPPFFTIIIRSLTILEGMALSVDPDFRLVRGSYPYVLRQLLSPESSNAGDDSTKSTPAALQALLVRLLTVNGKGQEIEWQVLRDLLRLASKASKRYNPKDDNDDTAVSRQTIELFFKFLTSRTGIFLKKPLVHELAQVIDTMASMGETNLLRLTRLPPLPGMKGPVNERRLQELQSLLETFQLALAQQRNNADNNNRGAGGSRSALNMEAAMELVRELMALLNDISQDAGPILAEIQSVIQLVAVEVLEIRGSRAMRSVLQLASSSP